MYLCGWPRTSLLFQTQVDCSPLSHYLDPNKDDIAHRHMYFFSNLNTETWKIFTCKNTKEQLQKKGEPNLGLF